MANRGESGVNYADFQFVTISYDRATDSYDGTTTGLRMCTIDADFPTIAKPTIPDHSKINRRVIVVNRHQPWLDLGVIALSRSIFVVTSYWHRH